VPRGRQYYDPIIQAPSKVESASDRRIELYPEQDVRDNTTTLRWVGRLVDDTGQIIDKAAGSFDHDDALRQAQELWPGLEVFELREESEDSTHEGMGPSPRLWQNQVPLPPGFAGGGHSAYETPLADLAEARGHVPPAVVEAPPEEFRIMPLVIERPGIFIRVEDVLTLLEGYAAQFDGENNPSAALGLREAASALREAF
jgi:hypothetical protein